jgi:hypothetical protein
VKRTRSFSPVAAFQKSLLSWGQLLKHHDYHRFIVVALTFPQCPEFDFDAPHRRQFPLSLHRTPRTVSATNPQP